MNEVNVTQLLSQMRAMAETAKGTEVNQAGQSEAADFSAMLKNSINKVNETQQTASDLTTAFASGDPSTDISEVMVAMQKASVSFQAMVQVRNKLVSAYEDIMNMPV